MAHSHKKRDEVLQFVNQFQSAKGYPPTVREIGEGVGLASPSSVQAHLKSLERDGMIERDPSKPRALKIQSSESHPMTETQLSETVRVPILGRVAAGVGVLAYEDKEGELDLSRSIVGFGEHFALQVRGDSMVDMGIYEDDYVIARSQKSAERGDIVVAGIPNDEATIKVLTKVGEYIELTPANERYLPMSFHHSEVEIFGKVTTLVRKFS